VEKLDILNGNQDDEKDEGEVFDKNYLDRYLSEELMPVMLGRLSNNARFVKKIGKKGSEWELMASTTGLKSKSKYNNRCNSMNTEMLVEVFQKKANYDVLADWIKKNKPDKLKEIEQFKEAFKDFDPAWLKDDDTIGRKRSRKDQYFELPLKKDIFVFKVDDNSYQPKPFPAEALVLKYDGSYGSDWQFFLANQKWKKGKEEDDDEDDDTDNDYSSFIPVDGGLSLLPYGDIFPEMSKLLDNVNVPQGECSKMAVWFVEFKKKLSAYTTLINL
jgi:hypothetical protein